MDASAIGSDLIVATGTTMTTPGTWSSVGCVESVTPNTVTRSFRDRRPCINATNRKITKVPDSVDYGGFSAVLRFDEDTFEEFLVFLEAGTKKLIGVVLGETGKAFAGRVYIESIGSPELNDQGDVLCSIACLIIDEFQVIVKPALA